MPPAKRGGGGQWDQNVLGQPVRIHGAEGDGVISHHRSDHLGTLEGGHRPGGQRPGGHAQSRQHARGPQQGQRQGARPVRLVPVADQIDQLVLDQTLVDHGQPSARDEPPRREGGGAELVGTVLGRQSPFDDGEGGLGL